MKNLIILFAIFSIVTTACTKKEPKPKLCTVVIPEPSITELNKYNNGEDLGKKK